MPTNTDTHTSKESVSLVPCFVCVWDPNRDKDTKHHPTNQTHSPAISQKPTTHYYINRMVILSTAFGPRQGPSLRRIQTRYPNVVCHHRNGFLLLLLLCFSRWWLLLGTAPTTTRMMLLVSAFSTTTTTTTLQTPLGVSRRRPLQPITTLTRTTRERPTRGGKLSRDRIVLWDSNKSPSFPFFQSDEVGDDDEYDDAFDEYDDDNDSAASKSSSSSTTPRTSVRLQDLAREWAARNLETQSERKHKESPKTMSSSSASFFASSASTTSSKPPRGASSSSSSFKGTGSNRPKTPSPPPPRDPGMPPGGYSFGSMEYHPDMGDSSSSSSSSSSPFGKMQLESYATVQQWVMGGDTPTSTSSSMKKQTSSPTTMSSVTRRTFSVPPIAAHHPYRPARGGSSLTSKTVPASPPAPRPPSTTTKTTTTTMDDLTRQWSSHRPPSDDTGKRADYAPTTIQYDMADPPERSSSSSSNDNDDNKPKEDQPSSAATRSETPRPSVPSPTQSNVKNTTLEELATEWGSRNQDSKEETTTMPPTQVFVSTPPTTTTTPVPTPSSKTPTVSSNVLEQLAMAWTTTNQAHEEHTTMPPTQAFASDKAPVPSVTTTPELPSAETLEEFATTWGSMNQDSQEEKTTMPPTQAFVSTSQTITTPVPTRSPKKPPVSSNVLEQLAMAWTTTNQDHEDKTTMPPTQSFTSTPTIASEEAPVPSATTTPELPSAEKLEELATAWGSMNQDSKEERTTMPPSHVFVSTPPTTTPVTAQVPSPKTSTVSSNVLEQLAMAWTTTNRDHEDKTTMPPTQAFTSTPTIASEEASVPSVTTTPELPSAEKLEELATAWGSMNKDSQEEKITMPPTQAFASTPTTTTPPVTTPSSKTPTVSSNVLEQLAMAWTRTNQDHEDKTTMPPTQAFTSTPTIASQEAPVHSKVTTTPELPSAKKLEELAAAWGSMNQDSQEERTTMPPSHAFVSTPPPTTPVTAPVPSPKTPTVSSNVLEQLAMAWTTTNQDHEEQTTMPPTQAFESAPTTTSEETGVTSIKASEKSSPNKLEELATAWGSRNQDSEEERTAMPPTQAFDSPPSLTKAPSVSTPGPKKPTVSSNILERLAMAWTTTNQDHDDKTTMPPTHAFVSTATATMPKETVMPTPVAPVPVSSTASTMDDLAEAWKTTNQDNDDDKEATVPTTQAFASVPTMAATEIPVPLVSTPPEVSSAKLEELATEWETMNQDRKEETTAMPPTQAFASTHKTTKALPVPTPVPAPKKTPKVSHNVMDKLAMAWTTTNQDTTDTTTMPPTKAFESVPTTTSKETPVPSLVSTTPEVHSAKLDELATAWGSMNKDLEGERTTMPPTQAFDSPPTTKTTPETTPALAPKSQTVSSNVLEKLAMAWTTTNQDHEETTAMPPTQAFASIPTAKRPELPAVPTPVAPVPTPVTPVSLTVSMDQLAAAWKTTNQNHDEKATMPPSHVFASTTTATPMETPVPSIATTERGITNLSGELATAWGSMNKDHKDETTTMLPKHPVGSTPTTATTTPVLTPKATQPPTPQTPAVSFGHAMEKLAAAWGLMNQDKSDKVTMLPTEVSASPPKESMAHPVPDTPQTLVPTPPSPRSSAVSIDHLTTAWGSMNQDHDDTSSMPPTQAFSSKPSTPVSTPVPAPKPPVISSVDLDQLAVAWGSMNQDHDDTSSMPPTQAFSSKPSTPVSTPVPAPKPPIISSVDLDQLAVAWGSMNQDHDDTSSMPPTQAFSSKPSTPVSTPVPAPKPPVISSVDLDQLAVAWGSMNQDHDDGSTMPPTQAFIQNQATPYQHETKLSPTSPADGTSKQVTPNQSSSSSTPKSTTSTNSKNVLNNIFENIANIWGSMNQDEDTSSTMPPTAAFVTSAPATPPTPATVKESAKPAEPPVVSSATMDQLATQWGSMGSMTQDEDTSSTMPPTAAFVTSAPATPTTPATIKESAKPAEPPVVSSVTMDQLATQWGSMNQDEDTSSTMPPTAAFVTSAPATPPTPATIKESAKPAEPPVVSSVTMDQLATQWGSMNQDEDTSSTMPPTAAFVTSAPATPPTPATIKESAKPAEPPVVSSVTMDQLATQWGSMTQDEDTSSTMPPTAAFVTSAPATPTTPATIKESATPAEPPVVSSVTMDQLATQWGSMGSMTQDEDTSSTMPPTAAFVTSAPATPTTPATIKESAKPAEPPVVSSVTMDQLATQWGSMNQDEDTRSTMPPTAAFVTSAPATPPTPATIKESAKPAEPPVVSSVTMDQLATQWGSMNQDEDTSSTMPPTAAFVTSAPATPPTPATIKESAKPAEPPVVSSVTMDQLATQWGSMTQDEDTSSTMPPTAAFVTSAPATPTTPATIKESATPAEPPVVSSVTMDQLATQWGSMGSMTQDEDTSSTMPPTAAFVTSAPATPTTPATIKESAKPAEPPVVSSVTMDQLATQWGSMNQDEDTSSTMPPTAAFVTSAPATPTTPATIKESAKPAEPPVVSSVTMDQLATQWGSMNQDEDTSSTMPPTAAFVTSAPATPPTPATIKESAKPAEPPVVSSVTMDQLATQWGSMNQDEDTSSTMPPTAAFVTSAPATPTTPATIKESAKPAEPPVVSSVTMDQLATQWGSMNQDEDTSSTMPPTAAFVTSAPATPPTPATIKESAKPAEPPVVSSVTMDQLATQWGSMNQDEDTSSTMPPTAAFVTSAPATPPTPATIKESAKPAEPPVVSSVTMDQLATQWGSMNQDEDTSSTMPPTAAFVTSAPATPPTPATIKESAKPAEPPVVSSVTMDQLATQWGSMNQDEDTSSTMPPTAAFVTSAPATPTTPATIKESATPAEPPVVSSVTMDQLATQWGSMGSMTQDEDTSSTMPPTAAFVTSAPATPTTPATIKESAKPAEPPVVSSVTMDQLATQWGSMNKDEDPSSTMPPTAAFVTSAPATPPTPATINESAKPAEPPVVSSVTMDQLATQWGSMNQDEDTSSTMPPTAAFVTSATATPPTPATIKESAKPAEPPVVSSVTMDQLATQWGSMNQDEDTSSTMPPTAAFVTSAPATPPTPATIKESAKPAEPLVVSSVTMDQLATQWGSMNQDEDKSSTMPPTAAFVTSAPATPTTPATIKESAKPAEPPVVSSVTMDQLATQWGSMTQDEDPSSTMPPTAAFVTSAPATPPTPATIKESATPAEPPVVSSVTMDQLATQWGSMGSMTQDEDTSSTMPPTAAFVTSAPATPTTPATIKESAKPAEPPVVSSVTMDQLATQWGSMNKDEDPSSTMPPTAAFVTSAPATPPTPATINESAKPAEPPVVSSVTMDQLATQWGSMNQDEDTSSTMPPTAAFVTSATATPPTPATIKESAKPAEPPVVSSVTMDQLATQLGSMNQDEDTSSTMPPTAAFVTSAPATPPTPATIKESAKPAEPLVVSSVTMDQLATQWGSMNQDEDTSSTMPPTAAFVTSAPATPPTPATIKESAKPAEPPVVSSVTMDQLATQWGSMTQDEDPSSTMPPTAALFSSAPATPPTPATIKESAKPAEPPVVSSVTMDQLATQWGSMNQDEDTSSTMPPTAAFVTSAPATPPTPATIKESAKPTEPLVVSSVTMDQLATQWGSMNQDEDKSSTMPPTAAFVTSAPATPPTPATIKESAKPAEPPVVSSVTMDQLATQWGSMTQDEDPSSTMPPTAALFSSAPATPPTPATIKESAKPAEPPVVSSVTMDQLASQWGSMNQDEDTSSTMPPTAAFVSSAPATPPTPATIKESAKPAEPPVVSSVTMDQLASQWGSMNQVEDTSSTIPPTAAFVTSAPATPPTPTTISSPSNAAFSKEMPKPLEVRGAVPVSKDSGTSTVNDEGRVSSRNKESLKDASGKVDSQFSPGDFASIGTPNKKTVSDKDGSKAVTRSFPLGESKRKVPDSAASPPKKSFTTFDEFDESEEEASVLLPLVLTIGFSVGLSLLALLPLGMIDLFSESRNAGPIVPATTTRVEPSVKGGRSETKSSGALSKELDKDRISQDMIKTAKGDATKADEAEAGEPKSEAENQGTVSAKKSTRPAQKKPSKPPKPDPATQRALRKQAQQERATTQAKKVQDRKDAVQSKKAEQARIVSQALKAEQDRLTPKPKSLPPPPPTKTSTTNVVEDNKKGLDTTTLNQQQPQPQQDDDSAPQTFEDAIWQYVNK